MNKEIRAFEDKIVETFNSSGLPIEVKRLVAQNVLNVITKKADEVILQEIRNGNQEEIYLMKKEEE